MGLQRSVENQLTQWFDDPAKKALLVTGARQVGKTYSVREFAHAHYETVLEINFVATPAACSIFEGDLDANTLISNLTAFSQTPLNAGHTLVFLDEIQECPRARAAIKFLVDDGRFDYIESGSLLGVLYNAVPSLPVGYEHTVRMFPLTMKEFFLALGVQPQTIDLVHECYEARHAVPNAVHERLIRMVRLYLACGGMPAAVDELQRTQDLARCALIQSDIVGQYRQDIAKYAPNKPHVKVIFDAMPSEIIGSNKRFTLRDLAPTARMERYESDFMWLVDAGVALPCYNIRAVQAPLALNEQHSLFKLYPCDVGLLGAMLENPVQYEILQGDVSVNNGALLETLVAQELVSAGHKLRYFDKTKYGEVDFVLSQKGNALPLEVKSGDGFRKHRSVDNILAVDEWAIDEAIVLCNGNVELQDKVLYLPWYMTMCLPASGGAIAFPVEW